MEQVRAMIVSTSEYELLNLLVTNHKIVLTEQETSLLPHHYSVADDEIAQETAYIVVLSQVLWRANSGMI